MNGAGTAVSAARVLGAYGSPGATGSTPNQAYYGWGDFVIYNGTLYNFNVGTNTQANTDIIHYNLNTQNDIIGYGTTGGSQAAVNYDGTIYNVTTAVAVYNITTGTFRPPTAIAGGGWSGKASDAAEYFKFSSDYGDAPAGYSCPYHQLVPCSGTAVNLRLGATVDYEVIPGLVVSGANAIGDDVANNNCNGTTNDEVGIASFPVLNITPAGATAAYSVTVTVANTSGISKILYGWIDFNRDGNFASSEYTSATVAANATSGIMTFAAKSGAAVVSGLAYARF